VSAGRRLVDSSGIVIRLGAEVGRGGEGTVYALSGVQDIAVKVFHGHLPEEKADKIQHLMALASDQTLKALAALPIDLIRDDTGLPIGLVLPLVRDHRDVHHLYNPRSRRQDFPTADWRFLLHTAGNLSKAMAAVHHNGLVIGDVNQGSVLVSQQATVRLIDVDSFQVPTSKGVRRCTVGVGPFTPPELQGADFKKIDRTPNHDAFGLAVLIFHLLMMGRHPYAGVHRGANAPQTLEQSIGQDRYVYTGSSASPSSPPGSAPPVDVLHPAVRNLFETAFAPSHRRPSARAWMDALGAAERALRQCRITRAHVYADHLRSCPWCAYEGRVNVVLFGTRLAVGPAARARDLSGIWGLVDRAPALPEVPAALRALASAADPPMPPLPRVHLVGGWICLLVGAAAVAEDVAAAGFIAFVGAVLLFALGARARQPGRELHSAAVTARKDLKAAIAAMQRQRDDNPYVRGLTRLQELRHALEQLPREQQERRRGLDRDREKAQRTAYLESRLIMDAQIPGIGPGRKSTLSSFGIDSAADVQRHAILAIPNFGPKLADALITWRNSVEARFRFDPTKPLDPRVLQALEREFSQRREALEVEVVRLGGRLQGDQSTAVDALRPLLRAVERAADQTRQAQAAVKAGAAP
jgi:DNA-binding helix-hairpin-helix protein with protein kinase domain